MRRSLFISFGANLSMFWNPTDKKLMITNTSDSKQTMTLTADQYKTINHDLSLNFDYMQEKPPFKFVSSFKLPNIRIKTQRRGITSAIYELAPISMSNPLKKEYQKNSYGNCVMTRTCVRYDPITLHLDSPYEISQFMIGYLRVTQAREQSSLLDKISDITLDVIAKITSMFNEISLMNIQTGIKQLDDGKNNKAFISRPYLIVHKSTYGGYCMTMKSNMTKDTFESALKGSDICSQVLPYGNRINIIMGEVPMGLPGDKLSYESAYNIAYYIACMIRAIKGTILATREALKFINEEGNKELALSIKNDYLIPIARCLGEFIKYYVVIIKTTTSDFKHGSGNGIGKMKYIFDINPPLVKIHKIDEESEKKEQVNLADTGILDSLMMEASVHNKKKKTLVDENEDEDIDYDEDGEEIEAGGDEE